MSPGPSREQETIVTVRQGDDLFKIAAKTGVPWRRIWDHPDNQELVKRRKTPSILLAGDKLVVPQKERKDDSGQTEQRHRFRLKRQWVWIRLKICTFGKPRAREPYHVLVDGQRFDGKQPKTDDEGLVECRIPADAEKAIVVLGEEGEETEYELLLGHIDPIDTPQGKHSRLQNLGYYDGGIETPYDDETLQALTDFLTDLGETNPRTDYPDDECNRRKLEENYGS